MIDASWINAVIGGALIGLASGGLMLLDGRLAGVSGIFHRVVEGNREYWRWAFLLGLVIAGLAAHFWQASAVAPTTDTSLSGYVVVIFAGLLVGFGTRMGNGCTSGHGVCGLARLSPRSLLAVPVFLGAGMLVTAAMRFSGAM